MNWSLTLLRQKNSIFHGLFWKELTFWIICINPCLSFVLRVLLLQKTDSYWKEEKAMFISFVERPVTLSGSAELFIASIP